MKEKKICIYTNNKELSKKTEKILREKAREAGFTVSSFFSKTTDLIVCIGGDGGFLRAVHEFDFPETPFVGINTGHLGFFQEVGPEQIDRFLDAYKNERYAIQTLSTVEGSVLLENGDRAAICGLNEIVIKGADTYPVHLHISIGGSFIEKFSGDGILVATSAGSTAYNYSLGGSIVDPRLRLIQVTPIAPMNTTAYRSLTSSVLLPAELEITVVPEHERHDRLKLAADGVEYVFENVEEINIGFSEKTVKLLRFSDYDFWNKVKSKFLQD